MLPDKRALRIKELVFNLIENLLANRIFHVMIARTIPSARKLHIGY